MDTYSYEKMKKDLFTDEGQRMFLSIRDNIKKLLGKSGAFTVGRAISNICGDTWLMLACVDRLAELEEIRLVSKGRGTMQSWVYTEY